MDRPLTLPSPPVGERERKRATLLALLLLGSALITAGRADAAAGPEASRGSGAIVVRGDRLTVRVTDAPLHAVLRTLERQSGIRIPVDPTMAERISVAFEDLALEEGVRRLVGSRPAVFVYEAAEGGAPRLVEVLLYGAGRSRLQEAASAPAPTEPAEAGPTLADGEADVGALLEVLKRDPDPDAREDALAALQHVEAVPAGPLAETALRDSDPMIRRKALKVLGEHDGVDPRTKAAVGRAARGDPDEEVREAAGELLERLAEEQP